MSPLSPVEQNLLICGPIVVLFHDTILPLFVRYKIKEELDSAKDAPIVFKTQMPAGAFWLGVGLGLGLGFGFGFGFG